MGVREKGLKEERGLKNIENKEREKDRWNKKLIFFLELWYSAILKVELHCNTIAKKFAIVDL